RSHRRQGSGAPNAVAAAADAREFAHGTADAGPRRPAADDEPDAGHDAAAAAIAGPLVPPVAQRPAAEHARRCAAAAGAASDARSDDAADAAPGNGHAAGDAA